MQKRVWVSGLTGQRRKWSAKAFSSSTTFSMPDQYRTPCPSGLCVPSPSGVTVYCCGPRSVFAAPDFTICFSILRTPTLLVRQQSAAAGKKIDSEKRGKECRFHQKQWDEKSARRPPVSMRSPGEYSAVAETGEGSYLGTEARSLRRLPWPRKRRSFSILHENGECWFRGAERGDSLLVFERRKGTRRWRRTRANPRAREGRGGPGKRRGWRPSAFLRGESRHFQISWASCEYFTAELARTNEGVSEPRSSAGMSLRDLSPPHVLRSRSDFPALRPLTPPFVWASSCPLIKCSGLNL